METESQNYSFPAYKHTFYEKYMKRVLDFIVSLLALIVLFPINLIVAFLVKVKLGSPIFFKQVRIGKDEKVDSGTLYALVFMPAKAKQNVFATAGTKAYSQNSGLDKDHDGMITKADLAAKVRSKMK